MRCIGMEQMDTRQRQEPVKNPSCTVHGSDAIAASIFKGKTVPSVAKLSADKIDDACEWWLHPQPWRPRWWRMQME